MNHPNATILSVNVEPKREVATGTPKPRVGGPVRVTGVVLLGGDRSARDKRSTLTNAVHTGSEMHSVLWKRCCAHGASCSTAEHAQTRRNAT